eukprot:746772-Hanusia_phi.AAC.6
MIPRNRKCEHNTGKRRKPCDQTIMPLNSTKSKPPSSPCTTCFSSSRSLRNNSRTRHLPGVLEDLQRILELRLELRPSHPRHPQQVPSSSHHVTGDSGR